MKHEWIEDVGVNISQYDDVVKVDVCKYCDCQKWKWLNVDPGVIKPQEYMLLKGTQYWKPDEECPDTYKLRSFKPIQQTLFLLLFALVLSSCSMDFKYVKRQHQTKIRQIHQQSSETDSYEMNKSFAPKGQYIFFKLF